jgi:transcriptional regulator
LTFDNKVHTLLSNVEVSMADKTDLLQGTLDLLILRTLRLGPLHGWGISKRVRSLSDDVLQINQGSLYPALYRLEDRGLIDAEWGISPEGRKAKFYRLTDKGRAQLAEERASWRAFAGAVEAVLKGT